MRLVYLPVAFLADFLAAVFFAGDFLPAAFLGDFLAADFLAAVFFAGVFLAAAFLGDFLAVAFFGADFLAGVEGFFAIVQTPSQWIAGMPRLCRASLPASTKSKAMQK